MLLPPVFFQNKKPEANPLQALSDNSCCIEGLLLSLPGVTPNNRIKAARISIIPGKACLHKEQFLLQVSNSIQYFLLQYKPVFPLFFKRGGEVDGLPSATLKRASGGLGTCLRRPKTFFEKKVSGLLKNFRGGLEETYRKRLCKAFWEKNKIENQGFYIPPKCLF